jgi:hypothetical protein
LTPGCRREIAGSAFLAEETVKKLCQSKFHHGPCPKAETLKWEITMRQTFVLTTLAVIATSIAWNGGALAAAVHESHYGVPSIDRTASGLITGIDANQHTITLSNGVTYAVPPYVDFGKLKTGEHVSVVYTYYLDKEYSDVKNVRVE